MPQDVHQEAGPQASLPFLSYWAAVEMEALLPSPALEVKEKKTQQISAERARPAPRWMLITGAHLHSPGVPCWTVLDLSHGPMSLLGWGYRVLTCPQMAQRQVTSPSSSHTGIPPTEGCWMTTTTGPGGTTTTRSMTTPNQGRWLGTRNSCPLFISAYPVELITST